MPTDIVSKVGALLSGTRRLVLDDAFAATAMAAREAASSPWNRRKPPTPAQALRGNYKMGPARWQGLPVHVENPANTIREGTSPDGTRWRNVMQADYGYFVGTRGADGDGVDVFLGPYPESTEVWFINQTDAAGAFDEHKVMAGFIDAGQATDAYRLSYSPGWNRFGTPIRASLAQLRWWLKFADKSRAFSLDLVPPEPEMTAPATAQRVLWDSAANPAGGMTLAHVLYGMRRHDGEEGLMLDPLALADITEGAEVVRLDALVVQAGRLQQKMDALLRIMAAVGVDLQPLSVQISDPVKRFGGVHLAAVFELSDGQTITAWFHNPDVTPTKLGIADDLVSWKWQINKKDVTIWVAPERGQDLNMREVARRIIKLAAKNSAAFARANAKRAEKMAAIAELKTTVAQRRATLDGLLAQIEVAKQARSDREAAASEAWWGSRMDAEGVLAVADSLGFSANAYGLLARGGSGMLSVWKEGMPDAVKIAVEVEPNQDGRAAQQYRVVDGDKFTSFDLREVLSHLDAPRLAAEAERRAAADAQAAANAVAAREGGSVPEAATAEAAPTDTLPAPAAFEFADATEEARGLLAIGAANPAAHSTYKTAVDVEHAARDLGLSVHWEATQSLPQGLEPALALMDDAVLDMAKELCRLNVFEPGDKVVSLEGNLDLEVVRQDGYKVYFRGRNDWLHANRLKLASGKPPRVRLLFDGCADPEEVQAVLDTAADLAQPYLQQRAVFDFVGAVDAAIAELQVALDVVTTNEPINRARGDLEQADLEAANAAQFRLAIEVLSARSTLDDASGGLFGDGDAGYIKGDVSRGAQQLATVHVRDDGMTAFLVAPAIANATVREAVETGWRDDWRDVLRALKERAEALDEDTASATALADEQAKREAAEAQEHEASGAALSAAAAFGREKAGFVAAVLNTGSDAIKRALARQPAGSFAFVVTPMSIEGQPGYGVVMFSRQQLSKSGRSIDPNGKIGNAQVSPAMPTAAEAYASGIQALANAGGVVLGAEAVPPPAEAPSVAEIPPEPAAPPADAAPEPAVEAVSAEPEVPAESATETVVAPAPEPAPDTAAQRGADIATLSLVAEGNHPDMLEPELADTLLAILTAYEGDAEVQALGERAYAAFERGALAATA